MKHLFSALVASCILAPGCATKTICANGSESFRSVLDPNASCKVRIRQVVVGTDIRVPSSIAFDSAAVNWSYEWAESEFKAGQIMLGHIVLRAAPASSEMEKR